LGSAVAILVLIGVPICVFIPIPIPIPTAGRLGSPAGPATEGTLEEDDGPDPEFVLVVVEDAGPDGPPRRFPCALGACGIGREFVLGGDM
jgi:hypothetical protein